jgi:presequence protease
MSVFDFYNLEWTREIPELGTLALFYKHKKTGAEVLVLENDDENKVFGLGLRTLPHDSTGIAHILEHVVLGGSRKYSVRDPFLEMLKSSLQTYLNALTASDHTMYPVASQNEKDFHNLVDVYLDAVFHPLLLKQSFLQEGWHYEINPETNELSYKGVVFNEMKGVHSSPDSILYMQIGNGLFPDNEYSLDSGGDPLDIPQLTYKQFVDFHRRNYHPSNARIMFYGNGDRERNFTLLENYLSEFERSEQTEIPALQTPFNSVRTAQATYPASQGSVAKAYATTNWMLHTLTDPTDRIGFEVLNYMLLESDAAPLKNALLESELGEDLAGPGYDPESRQHTFSAGLKGVAVEDVEKVEKLILDSLYELVKTGIPQDLILGALNRVEFDYRENKTGSYPKGLILFFKALQNWIYDGDPLEGVFFAQKLSTIRERVASGEKYFENLIKSQLLNNTHRLNLRLLPDVEHIARRDEEEARQLREAGEKLTAAERKEITKQNEELEAWQKQVEDAVEIAKLPVLRLQDIPKETTKIPQVIEQIGPAEVFRHDLNTNGIIYLGVGFDISNLPQELLPYLAIFSEALMRLGTKRYSYEEMATRIDMETGGLDIVTHVTPVMDTDKAKLLLFFSGKSTVDKVGNMLQLMKELMLEVNLTQQDKFRQVILEEKAKVESSISRSGHSYALNRVSAHYRQSCVITEELSGVNYYHSLKRLQELVDHDWEFVLGEFNRLYEIIFKQGRLVVNVTAEPSAWDTCKGTLTKWVQDFPDNRNHGLPPVRYETLSQSEGLAIPASVNFVGQGFDLTKTGYELHGSVYLIQNLLNLDYMWNKVRVQGGAYGGFADYQIRVGVLMFASYRDPNVARTLQVYRELPDYLKQLKFEDSEMEKHIIGAIGRLDKYMDPDTKGWIAFDRYLSGMTDEVRQRLRDQLLTTTARDINSFGEILSAAAEDGSSIAIVGEREKILQADEGLQLGLKVESLL